MCSFDVPYPRMVPLLTCIAKGILRAVLSTLTDDDPLHRAHKISISGLVHKNNENVKELNYCGFKTLRSHQAPMPDSLSFFVL